MTFLIQNNEELKGRVAWYLKTYHVGQDKAIKKRELLKALFGEQTSQNESYNNMDDRVLREMINLANEEGALICSSSRCGYWWADSLADGLKSVRENEARAKTQLHNTSVLEANLQKAYGGQLEMFYGR